MTLANGTRARGRRAGRISTPALLGLAACAALLLVVLVAEAVDSDVPTRAAASATSGRVATVATPATRVAVVPPPARPATGSRPSPRERWPTELAARMAAKVSFKLIDQSPVDAFGRLSRLTGLPIVVDGSGGKERVKLTVTLQVDDATAENALARICRLAGLASAWCDGAVLVASASRIAAVRKQHQEFGPYQQPPTKELAAKAAQAVSVRLRDADLTRVVGLIGGSAGLEVSVAGRTAGGAEPTFSLALTNAPADRVLRWAARLTSRVCVWRRDKLVITSPAAARRLVRPKRKNAIRLDVADAPLPDVLRAIAEQASRTVVLDRASLGGQPPKVTVRLDDVSVSKALREVAAAAGLAYTSLDGALFLAKASRTKSIVQRELQWRRYQEPPSKLLAAQLKKPVTCDFTDTPIEDALLFLAAPADLPLVFDTAVLRRPAHRVSLQAGDMRVDRALRWACRIAGVVHLWRDDALLITTAARARQAIAQDKTWPTPQPPPTKQLAAVLAKPLSLDFTGTSLKGFASFLTLLTQRPAAVDLPPGMAPPTLAVRVHRLPLAAALRAILRSAGLVHVWRANDILITTPALAAKAGE